MPDVIGRRFVAVMAAACESRLIANGAKTDIGARVLRVRRNVQAAEVPAVIIELGEAELVDSPTGQGMFDRVVTFEGLVTFDSADPLLPEDVMHDLWRAVDDTRKALKLETGFKRLTVVRMNTATRDEGNNVVGAMLELRLRFYLPCDTME